MNYTLIFSKNSQIDNRNSPAGSDLTPMEYTLMMIVEEKGEGAIPGFTAGSTTIATNGEDRGLTNNLLFSLPDRTLSHLCGATKSQTVSLFVFHAELSQSTKRGENSFTLRAHFDTVNHSPSVFSLQYSRLCKIREQKAAHNVSCMVLVLLYHLTIFLQLMQQLM